MGPHHASGCCFIIPSDMLRKLAAAAASETERRLLLTQIEDSAFLRGERAATALFGRAFAVPAGEKRRTVFDASHQTRLPGKLVRGETDPTELLAKVTELQFVEDANRREWRFL